MKSIVITGGGRGLGKATAMKLASLGHRVLLTARSAASGEAAKADILAVTPKAQVEARTLDLASMQSVKAFGRQLSSEGNSIDVLINCAGVMQQNFVRQVTVDGFEETLAVNAFAPFLLTSLLLPSLQKAADARVINVSSRLHLPGSRGVPVNFDFADPSLVNGYHPDRAYKNSKLTLLWFTFELQRRLGAGSVTALAVCPGFVPVTAAASTHGFQAFMLKHVLAHMPFARTVDEAVASLTFMALEPGLSGVGDRFYGEMKPIDSSPESHDVEKAAKFWALAEQATQSGAWPIR